LPTLAWGVTIAELVLGLLLIVGLWRKPTAVLAALAQRIEDVRVKEAV
jgi:uncharacterized membrane protein YphA (DoxX/SURF4 family)